MRSERAEGLRGDESPVRGGALWAGHGAFLARERPQWRLPRDPQVIFAPQARAVGRPPVRYDLVNSLRAAIASGTYVVSAEQVAGCIVARMLRA